MAFFHIRQKPPATNLRPRRFEPRFDPLWTPDSQAPNVLNGPASRYEPSPEGWRAGSGLPERDPAIRSSLRWLRPSSHRIRSLWRVALAGGWLGRGRCCRVPENTDAFAAVQSGILPLLIRVRCSNTARVNRTSSSARRCRSTGMRSEATKSRSSKKQASIQKPGRSGNHPSP